MLVLGTHDGLYRVEDVPFERPELTRDCGTVYTVDVFDGVGLLAATADGLFHSRDGQTWTDLGVPQVPVVAVAVSPDNEVCYAGTYPARVYRLSVTAPTAPEGDDWTECQSFRASPARTRGTNRSPRERGAQVRTLGVHRGEPERVVAGLEVGGVCVSDDTGATWQDRSHGLHDDVHHVLVRSPEEYVAACGNGLYRTRDAGRRWIRLDTDYREFWYNYHRESVWYDGRLYTAANGWGPQQGTGTVVAFGSEWTPERVSFPGNEGSFVLSWAPSGDRLFAGTMQVGERFEQDAPADVLARDDDGWTVAGTAPAAVRSLAVY